jgi:hypothetical protein
MDPRLWLDDYRLGCQAGRADDELFIIHNLPLFLVDAMRTWLQHLLEGHVCCWDDLVKIFMGHF